MMGMNIMTNAKIQNANNPFNAIPFPKSNNNVLTMKPLNPTYCIKEYSEESENQDLRMAYWLCHMGSTLDGSVRRRRLSAVRDMYCVVPRGEITLVFGSASNE